MVSEFWRWRMIACGVCDKRDVRDRAVEVVEERGGANRRAVELRQHAALDAGQRLGFEQRIRVGHLVADRESGDAAR